ncbi:hypothetical protein [Microbispora sp. NPDC049125]|uniref:hypothetical protein n=1 Tax=Microbispora sp. NPDC049125 TaxID=3154929 RepID=UPI00346675F3
MNDIVNRLRDATHRVGETIGEPPPLDLDVRGRAGLRRTRTGTRTGMRTGTRTWFVPVAAAASVTVAVAVGTLVGGGAAINVAGATTAGPAAAPSFIARTWHGGIQIMSVADGKVTAELSPPEGGGSFTQVQAAQDNRLFYAASRGADCGSRLYRFTLDGTGEVESYGAVEAEPPKGTFITALAVSGDGVKLAYGIKPCRTGAPALVTTDTATGDSRTWTSGKDVSGIADVSMSADGRYAIFRRWSGLLMSVRVPPPAPARSPGAIAPSPDAKAVPRPEASGEVHLDPRTGAVREPSAAEPPGTVRRPVMISAFQCRGAGTSELAPTPKPVPSSAAARIARPGSVMFCRSSFDVWLLDTTASGGTLDQARKLTLRESYGDVSGDISDVALTPDGTRVIAAYDGAMRPPGTKRFAGGIIAYGTDGRPREVVFRSGDGGGLLSLDVDGTGQNLLVQRDAETGVISGSRYRALPKTRDGIVRPMSPGGLAW